MNPVQAEADRWIEAAKMAHEMGDDEASYQAMVQAGLVLLGPLRRAVHRVLQENEDVEP